MNTTRDFFAGKDSILVAAAFDRFSMPLMRSGAALAHRFQKKLVLLHVCEPWLDWPFSKPFAGESSPLWNVTQAIAQNTAELAAGRMAELASMTGVPTETLVLSGRPIDCIKASIKGFNACMLLLGAGDQQQKLLPIGFSTALSLCSEVEIPTLVLTNEDVVDLDADQVKERNQSQSSKRLKIMVADDLSPQSDGAVDFAFTLAESLPGTILQHVHISGITAAALKASIETAAATSHTPINLDMSADELWASLTDRLTERLMARSEGREEYLEAVNSTYAPMVRAGEIIEELARTITTLQPDMLIFGRHQAIHRKPFALGRVPFRTMLSGGRPVVVVPANNN